MHGNRSNISSGLITFTYMTYFTLTYLLCDDPTRFWLSFESLQKKKTENRFLLSISNITRMIESMIQFTYNKLTSVFFRMLSL